MDYGSKYYHESPTLYEGPLQAAILAAFNLIMSRRDVLMGRIEDAMRMELAPIPGETMSLSDIDQRLGTLEREFKALFRSSKKDGGHLEHTASTSRRRWVH